MNSIGVRAEHIQWFNEQLFHKEGRRIDQHCIKCSSPMQIELRYIDVYHLQSIVFQFNSANLYLSHKSSFDLIFGISTYESLNEYQPPFVHASDESNARYQLPLHTFIRTILIFFFLRLNVISDSVDRAILYSSSCIHQWYVSGEKSISFSSVRLHRIEWYKRENRWSFWFIYSNTKWVGVRLFILCA